MDADVNAGLATHMYPQELDENEGGVKALMFDTDVSLILVQRCDCRDMLTLRQNQILISSKEKINEYYTSRVDPNIVLAIVKTRIIPLLRFMGRSSGADSNECSSSRW